MHSILSLGVRSSVTLIALLMLGCGGSGTAPDQSGLVPGTYRARFEVPGLTNTPGALVGQHEFTFRVDNPEQESGFQLLTSRKRSRTLNGDLTEWRADYLSPATDRIIAIGDMWRVQWEYRDFSNLAANVTMVDDDAGGFRVRFCRGVRDPLENHEGHSCRVERID